MYSIPHILFKLCQTTIVFFKQLSIKCAMYNISKYQLIFSIDCLSVISIANTTCWNIENHFDLRMMHKND